MMGTVQVQAQYPHGMSMVQSDEYSFGWKVAVDTYDGTFLTLPKTQRHFKLLYTDREIRRSGKSYNIHIRSSG